MTISSITVRDLNAGDGATSSFATSFVFWNSSELTVTSVTSSGSKTTWAEGTQYSVTGGGGATGTIVVSTGSTDFTPDSSQTLVVESAIADHQETALPAGGVFPSTSIEEQLDRIVRQVQQLADEINRAVKLDIPSTYSGLTLPNPSTTQQFLRWNSGATGLENVTVSSSVLA